MPKKVGKYEIHKTLGEGTFGKVKRAFNTENDSWVAIKVLDKEKIQKQNMGAQVKKEISIMKLVRHPNVVQLKEVLASRTKIFIVLELVTGGELFDKIVSEGRFKDDTARFYFQQLCVGTKYCHDQGVCHRDLKPENLLLDGNDDLKISDFGLSALYEQGAETDRATLLHTTCGTPNYVAPEVLADKGYDGAAADTWSIGVILYVFLAGFLPFDEPTMSALFRKIQKADYSFPSWFSNEVKALLEKILVVEPERRMTLEDIMKDPWFGELPVVVEGANEAAQAAAASGGGLAAPPKSAPAAVKSGADTAVQGVDAEHHDGDQSASKSASSGAIKQINAFHLINMCSGSALNRMFTVADPKAARKVMLFVSSLPPDVVKEKISQALAKMHADLGCTNDEVIPADGKKPFSLKGIFNKGRGNVTVKASIKSASVEPPLCVVVVKRKKGDLITYQELAGMIDARLPAELSS